MQVDLTDREVGVILSALAGKKEFYESIRENPNGITKEAAEEALEIVKAAEEKLNSGVPEMNPGDFPKSEESFVSEKFLYIYVPDGIRDQEFEEELASRIPKTSDPEADNFFWSAKFNNFVVKAEFTEEAKEAVRARYDGDVVLNENPDWAKKPNTWQITEKNSDRDAEARISAQSAR
ncbi:hypothetical protein AKJ64_00225 [candidate division MSBL1 archaeon SCGC-AAA259E17]|uniref:Uncharacterized protein n=1 Tax=candidate division MSBL1 archaeon SCGC-AAA259E17 TaxID=1698263 RepID=A0A133UHH9_9EURY|nr:hypothetical protein AKJ64_00225 [candidate division MSBL1 archaeon SCGC-AAA259E17]